MSYYFSREDLFQQMNECLDDLSLVRMNKLDELFEFSDGYEEEIPDEVDELIRDIVNEK